jgi:hypothetical protein
MLKFISWQGLNLKNCKPKTPRAGGFILNLVVDLGAPVSCRLEADTKYPSEL